MDLLTALTAARARAAATPAEPAAWAALAELLDIADRGALDADAGFALAVDRWDALTHLVTLAPTAPHLRAQISCIAALTTRARDRGQPDLAVALCRDQLVAARLAMRVDATPEPAAEALADAAQTVAEDALRRLDRDDAIAAFSLLLEALYTLAQRTGRPAYALRIAGVHLHLGCQLPDPEAARRALLAARDVLDKLDAAGLRHPVQAQVRAEVDERLAALQGS